MSNSGTAMSRKTDVASVGHWWMVLFAMLLTVMILSWLRYLFMASVDHDEVEHAHVAFRILSGELPYRDFYQNHTPAFWLLVMQWVKAFPFSINAIMAGRMVNGLALLSAWMLGLRLLKAIPGNRTPLAMVVYSLGVIIVAFQLDTHIARPDPIMALFVTAGMCLVPLHGSPGLRVSFGLGLLFGLAISITPKALPCVLVVPFLVVIHCFIERSPRPLPALLAYGVGILIGLLPTVLWLIHNQLLEAFYFDVVELNSQMKKDWRGMFGPLNLVILISSVVGVLATLRHCKYDIPRHGNALLVVGLGLLCGLSLALITRHSGLYNYSLLLIPVSIGFACLVTLIAKSTNDAVIGGLLVAAIIGFPVTSTTFQLMQLTSHPYTVPKAEIQQVFNLARPGGRSCIGFSPINPVFCHSASELSNEWDLMFPANVREPRQFQRFQRIWTEAIELVIAQPPDILVRTMPRDIWAEAVTFGLIDEARLVALDALRPTYEVIDVNGREVWVLRDD